MGGYVCRFCGSDSENDSSFISLEISTGNRKIIIYVCRECRSNLAGSRITRCQRCGNIWLKNDAKMRGVTWTMARCSLCNTDHAAPIAGMIRNRSACAWAARVGTTGYP